MSGLGPALLNSLEMGLLLFVIAVGLNIVFGVLNIINFAHGALYMLGAYLAYTLMSLAGLSFWVALIIAPLGVAVIAVVIDRLMLEIYLPQGRSRQPSADFCHFAHHCGKHPQYLWFQYPGRLSTDALQGTVRLLGGSYPVYSLFVIFSGLVILAGLWYLFNRTRVGKIMRAAALDRDMAEALCINTRMVVTGVFAFGAWLAGVGGVIAAPMRTIDPGMGDKIIIESFIVVVIGGLGSFPGALLGALILGAIYGFGGRYFPEFNLLLPFLGMALVLLFKPTGLMGKGANA